MIDVTAVDEMASDAGARAHLLRLAAAQALTGATSAVILATGWIIAATLAPDVSLATVPLSTYVVGLAAGTLPTGAISRAYGRRAAFIIGTGCGSFSSGQLLANYGWSAVNMVVYPPVLLGLVVLTLASFAKRRRARLQAVSEFPDPSI